MARVDCRQCRATVEAAAPETRSVRGWGVLCADCADVVEVVTNDRGRFVRAYVPGGTE